MMVTICRSCSRTSPNAIRPASAGRKSTPFGREPTSMIIVFSMKKLTGMLSERGLTVDISEHAKEFLAREGYDPAFGARPLKRTLQKEIIDPLAMRLLEGKFKPGDTVFVNMRNGKVDMSLEPEPMSVH